MILAILLSIEIFGVLLGGLILLAEWDIGKYEFRLKIRDTMARKVLSVITLCILLLAAWPWVIHDWFKLVLKEVNYWSAERQKREQLERMTRNLQK